VLIGVGVNVAVCVAVGVFVAVAVGVRVAVWVGIGVEVAVRVAVGVRVDVLVGVGVRVGGGLMLTVQPVTAPSTETPARVTSLVRGKVRWKVTAVPPGGVAAWAKKRMVARVNVPLAVAPSRPAE